MGDSLTNSSQGKKEVSKRNIVEIHEETISNVSTTNFPGHHYGECESWSADKFSKKFKVKFHSNKPYDCTFSLVGIDASIANAFRRILIAEVPTLAIEDVFISNNTSIIQDEVLAHRLGLIPLKGNTQGIRWLKRFKKANGDTPGDIAADFNTIVLKLDVECTWNSNGRALASQGETDVMKLYKNAHVYAKQIRFEPQGIQTDLFSHEKGSIEPAYPDILIAKLRPGQAIRVEMHCIKGIGSDHAKFSPVATASYRLLPYIEIKESIIGDDAEEFAKCFPPGVINLRQIEAEEAKDPHSDLYGHAGKMKAVVGDTIKDTVTRECLRHEKFKNKVKLGRIQDHFIFNIESTGQFTSYDLFLDSVRILKAKCQKLKLELQQIL